MRAGILDRMHAGSRIAAVTGPIALAEAPVVRERLAAFAALGPASRIAVRPDPDRWRWRHDPAALAGAVRVLPAPERPEDLLACADRSQPFRVTLAGDYLMTEHDHGIGEVQLALFAHLMITGVLAPTGELHRQIAAPDDGLIAAALRVFGGDPRRILRVLEILEQLPAPMADEAVDGGAGAATPVARVGYLRREQTAELRAWRDGMGSRVSMKTLVLAALVRAFDDAGVQLDPDVTVPIDLRRYLRAGVTPLGNLVAGLRFRHRPGDDPALLQQAMAETIATGRPVASGIRSAVTGSAALLARRTPAPGGRRPARLLFSGVHQLPQFGLFPWRAADSGVHLGSVDPLGPGDITVLSVEVHGAAALTATFHPDRHAPEVISAALQRVTADPVSLLR